MQINKLVATSVTCSFTHHNNDETSNPLTPTVMINHNSFCVSLYDCKNDVLLISEPRSLYQKGSHGCRTLCPSACLFLWIVINHRYVFRVSLYTRIMDAV